MFSLPIETLYQLEVAVRFQEGHWSCCVVHFVVRSVGTANFKGTTGLGCQPSISCKKLLFTIWIFCLQSECFI